MDRDELRALGSAPERVLVIDDDLGKTGTSVDDRLGVTPHLGVSALW